MGRERKRCKQRQGSSDDKDGHSNSSNSSHQVAKASWEVTWVGSRGSRADKELQALHVDHSKSFQGLNAKSLKGQAPQIH